MAWDFLFLFTLLVGLFTLLGFFAKFWWLLDILDHFRVQYLFTLVLIGFIQILGGKPIQVLITLFFAIINFLVIMPIFISKRKRFIHEGETLRILLANVLCENKQIDQVGNIIKLESPDIILLLEPDEIWLSELQKYVQEYNFVCCKPRDDNYGIAFFSRIPVERMDVRVFGELEIPSIEALLKFQNNRLLFVGTHLTPPKGGMNTMYRRKQIEDISCYVKDNQNPVMICGDFNLTPWSVFFRKFLHESGLMDSSKGFGLQPTWPTSFAPVRIPIDHCIVSPGIKIINRKLGIKIGSDHLPLVIDFTV